VGVVVNPESELGRELAKWNKPYRFEMFPKMLYRAVKKENGKVVCGDAYDEAIDRQCQTTVQSEDELHRARELGWCESPQAALDAFEAKEREVADASARRLHSDQRLSEKARAEAAAADDATADHVADVPRKPGRPKKPVPVS
jgi:hypothetical protein